MAKANQSQEPVKVLMAGPGGVGKSAITIQFMYNEFVEDYEPTKADSYRKSLVVNGEPVSVDILDTAGQEDYASIRDQYLRSGHGFILVYAVSDRETFEGVKDIRHHIIQAKENSSIPMILVGNKADLPRVVDRQEAEQLASTWGVPYVETSAKTNMNVEDTYTRMCQLIMDNKLGKNSNVNRKKKRRCAML